LSSQDLYRAMVQPAWVAGRLQKESYFSRLFYSTILKRSSTYMTAVMIVATATGTHNPRATGRPRPCQWFSNALVANAPEHQVLSVLLAGIGYDYAMNAVWETKNKGVSIPHVARHLTANAPWLLAPAPCHTGFRLWQESQMPLGLANRVSQKLWKDIKDNYKEE